MVWFSIVFDSFYMIHSGFACGVHWFSVFRRSIWLLFVCSHWRDRSKLVIRSCRRGRGDGAWDMADGYGDLFDLFMTIMPVQSVPWLLVVGLSVFILTFYCLSLFILAFTVTVPHTPLCTTNYVYECNYNRRHLQHYAVQCILPSNPSWFYYRYQHWAVLLQ